MASPIVPLEKNSFSRFMPFLVGFMVFLAVLFLSIGKVIDTAGKKWSDGIENSMSIQILKDDNFDATTHKDIVDRALVILNQTAGVKSANKVSDDEVIEILTPWFGNGIDKTALPIPTLINVEFDAAAEIDIEDLKSEISQISENIIIDDYGVWRSKVESITSTVNNMIYTLILLILISTGVVIIAFTRGLMLMNINTLNMLILMGATDKFIARDFIISSVNIALKASAIGFVIAYGVFNLLFVMNDIYMDVEFSYWLIMALIIPVIFALSYVASFLTVKMTLQKRFYNI
ncbi:MAG: cell division protein FtsX [Alphaproteobacteria bacterium]